MNHANPELFRAEALAYRDRRLEGSILLTMPTSWRLIGFGLALVLLVAGVFLVFGTYSRVEVVPGTLTLNRGVATIAPSRAGVIEQAFVTDGMAVAKGDPLVAVRTEEYLADGSTAPERLRAALATQAKQYASQEGFLAAASTANLAELQQEGRGLQSELANVEVQILEQRRLVEVAEANLERAQEIAERGFVSRREVERLDELASTRRQQLSQFEQRAIAMKSDIAEVERARTQVAASTAGQIEAVRISRTAIEKELADAQARQGYVVRAPVAGLVTAVAARVGQDAEVGERLMLLVPRGSTLRAELQLPSKAAGLVRKGQRVRLAIDAFPYNTFGTVGGKISEVSVAAYEDNAAGGQSPSYLVVVDLDRDHIKAFGKRQPLLPGMTLTARIVTHELTLLQWLFEPLYAIGRR